MIKQTMIIFILELHENDTKKLMQVISLILRD